MSYSIVAEFPLGTYRGNGSDGSPERLPAVTRLHAALLSAAGFGPRAARTPQGYAPSGADSVALRWVEDNPPDTVRIPAIEVNTGRAVAYRDDGTLKKSRTSLTTKKLGKAPDASVAVGGEFVWTWRTDPPEPVAAALDALCPDVAYLGTTESPVRLRTVRAGVPEPSHEVTLDPDPFAIVPGGLATDVPRPGRVDELTAAHALATGRAPSAARDRWGTDERSSSAVPIREAVAAARYTLIQAPLPDIPWPTVYLLPLKTPIPEQDRVRAAVAAHRGLIAVLGYGAPSLITGVYPPGEPRPTNRLALHLVDSSMPIDLPPGANSALAVLVPHGTADTDAALLSRALAGLDGFGLPGGRTVRVLGTAVHRGGAAFWREPAPGMVRLWETSPPAIPDTRGGRDTTWTFAHAALLSLGFVWKTQMGRLAGRGEEHYRAVVGAVGAAGAAVLRSSPVRSSDVTRYVHKVNRDAVVRPYRALLSVGDLGSATCVQAIGQSRHLGGGLLVPQDVAEGTPLAHLPWPPATPAGRGRR